MHMPEKCMEDTRNTIGGGRSCRLRAVPHGSPKARMFMLQRRKFKMENS